MTEDSAPATTKLTIEELESSPLLGERGAAMVEYALLLVFIAIVAIIALQVLGTTVSGQFDEINSGLTP